MTGTTLQDDQFQQIANLERQIKVLQQSIVPSISARVYGSTHASISNGAIGTILFDEEDFDQSDIHSTGSNTGRLTARVSGLYAVFAGITTTAAVSARVIPHIAKNGTSVARGTSMANTAGEGHVATLVRLDVGEYVEFQVQNFSGSSITPLAGNGFTHLEMVIESF